MHPSSYETAAASEIETWKRPSAGWMAKAATVVDWPLDRAGKIVMRTPGLGWAVERTVGGLVSVANDAAQWSVRRDAIYRHLAQASGFDVRSSADIYRLDLAAIDRATGWLGAKYQALALAEGTGTALLGLAGIAPDVASLVGYNLRAIGEYGTYCGFDLAAESERLFAMHILALASSPSGAVQGVAMAQLVKIARTVASRQPWNVLGRHTFATVLERMARALGLRLTRVKLGELIPVAGAALSGGFNAYYTRKVCDAAHHLYRERFLAEKYGADWIKAGPAEEIS
jgi:hypothetical protein